LSKKLPYFAQLYNRFKIINYNPRMKKNLLAAVLLTALVACNNKMVSKQGHFSKESKESNEKEERGEAAEAMDFWSLTRTFPDGIFHSNNLQTAFSQRENQLLREDDPIILPEWQSLGPANIAGRMLCLAFHPTDSLTMWAGSASGGLWKSKTGGNGARAWQRVKMGFPVLGVGAIAVSPDGKTLFVGTGEVYNSSKTGSGSFVRTQRGSYGIGILKSTDGGLTWTKSLDWSQTDLRGVQKIVLNPSNPNTVFATTTEGVYRSYDAGQNWSLVNNTPMAIDFEFTPNDTNRLYTTFGCLNNAQNGIFRSLNGGTTWTKLTEGLPTKYTGKAMIHVVERQPSTLFASIADAERQIGLFKSSDSGDSWHTMNSTDVSAYQGWFAHDVIACPQNPDYVLHVGIDAWFSANGGENFSQISDWSNIPFGRTVDASGNYMHADIHGVYFSPFNPNLTYFLTDGGIYKNDNIRDFFTNMPMRFQQLNGGLQTTQFYANFSNSQQDSAFAMGGMQDNWTAIYDGYPNWQRVIGGDGMSTAIHPQDDNILFGSTQYLNVQKSNDRGANFTMLDLSNRGGASVFNAPFELAPSNPNVIYAGAERILRSDDAGATFDGASDFIDNDNSVNTIAINPLRENSLIVATFPTMRGTTKVFRSLDGAKNFTQSTGLPNRVFTDIAYAPKDTNTALLTVSGFGTQHIYRTTDGGVSWQPFGAGLPDVPANTVVFDPIYPQFVYVGNDLGTYYSADAGATWQPLSIIGLPEVSLVMHLSISPKNRKLRAATHGNGVFEMDLLTPQHLRQPLDKVVATANIETSNKAIRTDFYLKNTRQGDTISKALSVLRNAQLPMPTGLPIATTDVPAYPFPHPQAVPFNDSLFSYEIMPKRTIDPRDGISTYDIVLVSRYLLGVDANALSSPMKLIAADVNGDGSVDGTDLLLLRRLILHIDDRFREVPHWVFVPKTYTIPATPPRLSEIPQSYFFNPYALRNLNPFSFWAIKMGDINNSYEPNDDFRAPTNDNVTTRSEGVVLTTENVFLEEGMVYDLTLKTTKSTQFAGFQGTFNVKNGSGTDLSSGTHEGVEFLNAESKWLKNFGENNLNVTKNGQIAFSWNAANNQKFDAKTGLLTLRIKANKSGQLSEFLQLNSALTTATVFDEQGNEQRLSLQFEKTNPTITVDAQPNPFTDVVNVKISQNTEGVVQYSIFDNLGNLVFQNKQNAPRGVSNLRLNGAAINAVKSGIYFLKIETNEGSKTIKLSKM
jgi:photosystem II stability/assembly factor-like uncharacterized protein/flagellar hook assembly protein FlgD